MDEHRYKVGDRVKRTALKNTGLYQAGMLGEVLAVDVDGVRVRWADDAAGEADYRFADEMGKIEPDLPACYSGKPGPECGCVPCVSALCVGARLVAARDAHELPAGVARELSHLRQQIAPQPAGDWVSRKEHALVVGNRDTDNRALRAELEQTHRQLADAIRAKTCFGDVIGERDSLRRENHEQATRMTWLERELVRVTGKAKGNR